MFFVRSRLIQEPTKRKISGTPCAIAHTHGPKNVVLEKQFWAGRSEEHCFFVFVENHEVVAVVVLLVLVLVVVVVVVVVASCRMVLPTDQLTAI